MDKQFLVIKLDCYAGNVDEAVCVALTGYGANRYGAEQARAIFEEKVLSLVAEDQLPVQFIDFNTEYGSMPYSLDTISTYNLRLGIDEYTEKEDIIKMINLWKQAYGENIVISLPALHKGTFVVRILGFDLVKVVEQREPL